MPFVYTDAVNGFAMVIFTVVSVTGGTITVYQGMARVRRNMPITNYR